MPKFSSTQLRPTAPIKTTAEPIVTYNGAQGFSRDAKSELFLLAVANFVAQDTFYEKAEARDTRFTTLVQQVTQEDPDWMERMIPWLRNTANMRTASLVAAAEYCAAGGPHKRQVVASAMSRADEPAEFIGYWWKYHGRELHGGTQRGVADAVARLYTERNALRYNSCEHAIRMADVIEQVHPKPRFDWQSALYKYLLDERHHGDEAKSFSEVTAGDSYAENGPLPLLAQYHRLMAIPVAERRLHFSEAQAVFSWEQLSGWLCGPMDRAAWEAVIPSMGYMALLRNLRNFDNAEVSDQVAFEICMKLLNEEEVAKSRQFPIRFYSAWANTTSLRWAHALEKALEHSLANVPSLPGNTLIMVDTSGSMVLASYWQKYKGYERSKVAPWQHAAVFGGALAKKAEHADLFTYGTATHRIVPGISVLRTVDAIEKSPTMNQGTQTFQMLNQLYEAGKHNRVIILTDEQCDPHGCRFIEPKVPVYVWNFMGYKPAQDQSGADNRYTFGGVTDSAFSLLPLLENRNRGQWPF